MQLFVVPLCLFLLALAAPASVLAQDAKVFYDGKLSPKPAELSASQKALFAEQILPQAQKHWRELELEKACVSPFTPAPLDIATGAFFRPNVVQTALLYRYCETGHNMALNGLAVLEDGRLLSHFVYEGAWECNLGAAPDLNANGANELLVAMGGVNMGQVWRSIRLLKLSPSQLESFGQTQVYEDSCGLGDPKGMAKAFRLYVKPGSPPTFFRETYLNKSACTGEGAWRKSMGLAGLSLDEDNTEFTLLK